MTYTAGQGFVIFMKELGNVLGGRSGDGDSSSTSRSLIRMLKLKQTHAWHRLAVLYGPVVWHWCRYLLKR